MTLLQRYLLRQNLVLLGACLGLGAGIYLLADLFDRLDDFLEAGLGLGTVVTYFLVKLPLIVSQILPAVFLLAVLLQLGIMAKSRELLALQAGGVSFGRLVRFFLIFSLLCSLLQLAFSQLVGVYGEQEAGRIWKEEVRKHQMDRRVLHNVWFRESNHVVKLESTVPARSKGEGITIYTLVEGRMEWERIVRAKKFFGSPRGSDAGWTLEQVEVLDPEGFVLERLERMQVPLTQDLTAFVAMDPHRDPTQLPLWQLGRVIRELGGSGSNVEGLRTVWHLKIAYAFSLLVMALLALALTTYTDNLYLSVLAGLILTFAYYGLTMVCVSMGERGLLPPLAAAWFGNGLFCVVALVRLVWHGRRRARV